MTSKVCEGLCKCTLILYSKKHVSNQHVVFQPATVSRCGMIYLEPSALGWDPILKSWLNTLPESYGKDFSKLVDALFQWIVPPCLTFVRKQCKVRDKNNAVYDIQYTQQKMNVFLK